MFLFKNTDQPDSVLSRKLMSSGFFWHEMEEEFRERNINWCFKGSDCAAMECALTEINNLRQGELYRHEEGNCSPLCKEKGVSNLHELVRPGIFNSNNIETTLK